jgi:hypothetical protein
MSAETLAASANTTPESNNSLFNMLKSPRVFELNSKNSRSHAKIKSGRALKVKTHRDFRKSEQYKAAAIEKRGGSASFLLKGFGV